MKNDTIPWPLVKELAFKMSDGAIKANSSNVEDFIFKNDRVDSSLVKEVFRRVINLGPDVFSAIIEKEVHLFPEKFNLKEAEIDADTCRKIINLLFQSFCKANPKIMVWWNGYKGAHDIFKSLFNYGLDHVKRLLDTYEPCASDIVMTKHNVFMACLENRKIPDTEALTLSNGATSYSFGGLKIEDLSSALRFIGIPIEHHHPIEKGFSLPTESASTFNNLKDVRFLPDDTQSDFRNTVADVDKLCLKNGTPPGSAEEILDYILDISIQGLLKGDRNPQKSLRRALHYQDAWLVCRNTLSKAGNTQEALRFVMRIKGNHHSFDGRVKSMIDFNPRGYPSVAKKFKSSGIRTIPKLSGSAH